jgi:hypothetical protein
MDGADGDRLDQIRIELEDALTSRIGELMGIVRATSELAQRIAEADAALDAEVEHDEETRGQLLAMRSALVDDLVRLKDALQ